MNKRQGMSPERIRWWIVYLRGRLKYLKSLGAEFKSLRDSFSEMIKELKEKKRHP